MISFISEYFVGLLILGILAYYAHVYIYRPELWQQMQQQAHERKMAKAAARREAGGKALGKIVETIIRIFFGRGRH